MPQTAKEPNTTMTAHLNITASGRTVDGTAKEARFMMTAPLHTKVGGVTASNQTAPAMTNRNRTLSKFTIFLDNFLASTDMQKKAR